MNPLATAVEPGGSGARRILYVEANEDGTVGGSHQVLFDLATRLDRSRYEPVALFYEDNLFADRLRGADVEVHLLDAQRRSEHSANQSGSLRRKLHSFARAIFQRARLIRELRIDAVHINNSPLVALDDWLPACRRAGVPCIATCAGDARAAIAFGRGEGRWFRRRVFRSFDAYLPVSRYVADALRAGGVPDDRIRLVHPGVDVDAIRGRLTRSREETRASLGLAPDELVAILVGNVREWKGQHVVIEALRQLNPAVRDRLRLLIVGARSREDEAYAKRLDAMVQEGGLASTVSFLGSRQDVSDLVAAADIALHTSVLPEPWGLVVLEALALGRPVIAANLGGPLEIVTPDVGLLFDASQPDQLTASLERLATDAALRAQLGAAGPARAQSFSVAQNVSDTVRVYEEVLDGGGA